MIERKSKKRISSKKRLAVIFVVVCLFLILCIGYATFLVFRNGNEYNHKALSQAAGSSTTILATPGNIVDANGFYLASSKKMHRLILDPKVMAEAEENYPGSLDTTCNILSEAFQLDIAELKKAYEEDTSKAYVRFGGGMIFTDEEHEAYTDLVTAFENEKKKTNEKVANGELPSSSKITARVIGVWFEEEYRREYPENSLLSKVIGCTTPDASQGLLGLELYYNDILRGTDGKEYTYVDEEGNVRKEVTEALDGYTLVTSLDVNITRIIREELEAFEQEIGAERVNILVTNPMTGEILSMVSDTDFDSNNPSDLSAFFTEEELENPAETFLLQEAYRGHMDKLTALTVEEQRTALLQQVQQNYAVTGTFEPGSTAKAFTLAAAIETGKVATDDRFYCDGLIEVGSYKIHCHMPTMCGNLTPIEAFARSCNVCFVRIANALGADAFSQYQTLFNLGQKTNIDLPGEVNTSTLLYTAEALHDIELATCSFGQSYNVTMVQMAAAYGSILNGGSYYEPHVVKKVVDSTGNTVKEYEPTLVRHTLSPSTVSYMQNALRYVITDGTPAGMLSMDGYDFVGKTGAAEKLPRGTGKYIVSLMSASSSVNPKFLLYVVVDEPHVEDQSVSYPAVHLSENIAKRLYEYYKIFPETETR